MEDWKADLNVDLPVGEASDLDVMEAVVNGFSPEIITSDEGVTLGLIDIADWECWDQGQEQDE